MREMQQLQALPMTQTARAMRKEEKMNSLENVKVGDILIVTLQWSKQLLTVEKVQKNFVIAGYYKFRKSDGYLVSSDSWTFASAKIATKEDLESLRKEVKRSKMIGQCRDIRFEELSDSQLEQILEIVNKKEI